MTSLKCFVAAEKIWIAGNGKLQYVSDIAAEKQEARTHYLDGETFADYWSWGEGAFDYLETPFHSYPETEAEAEEWQEVRRQFCTILQGVWDSVVVEEVTKEAVEAIKA